MGLMKNTVRLGATFVTFSGSNVSGSPVTLVISEQNSGSIVANVSGSYIVQSSAGVYYYDFLVPLGTGNLIYEWSGVTEGSAIVNRGTLVREWISS